MIRSIVLNDCEYVVPSRNMCVNDNTDFMKFLKAVCKIRKYIRPDVEDFEISIRFDDAVYYCTVNDGKISEGFKGQLNQIYKFFDYGVVVFEKTSKFNLKELAFSDKYFEVDLFGVNELTKEETSTYFNFVQELGVFIGDTLTDYNKVFIPVCNKEGQWYIGCMDLDTNAVTMLNQEEERIKDAVVFICNTLKITDKTETILIEDFAKPEFELATYALPINYKDKHYQFIFTSRDVIKLDDIIYYESGGNK